MSQLKFNSNLRNYLLIKIKLSKKEILHLQIKFLRQGDIFWSINMTSRFDD
jgi:hypothetical protein